MKKKKRKEEQRKWEKIFELSKGTIKRMKGDLECGMAANIMLDLMEYYHPPKSKGSLKRLP